MVIMPSKSTGAHFDVIVIGGGPAGMMAAGRAAGRGLRVALLEKNASLGKKLLITGGGRCNVTNNKATTRALLSKYKHNDKFLYAAFAQQSVADTLDFFHERNMATKEEAEGRVFPVSDSAQSVWDVLVNFMDEGGVGVFTSCPVVGVTKKNGFFEVTTSAKCVFTAASCIVATGGTSRPETGSTGEGFRWLKKFGHTVVENDFALVPIALRDTWVRKLAGITLTNVRLTTYQHQQKQQVYNGKLLFTHVGMSGPMVLNMSRDVGELLKYGDVVVSLDLRPDLDHGAVKQLLQAALIKDSNKMVKNTLGVLVPEAMVGPILSLAVVAAATPNHSLRSESRKAIAMLVKGVPLHVRGLLGAEKAVVSSGGVVLSEVDFRTMESRLVPGLFLVGDVLNIDRPSGGYSLQLCWTTGHVAGTHAST